MVGQRAAERGKVHRLVQDLIATSVRDFPERGTVDAPSNHGVYVIMSKRGVVHHVGSTYRGKAGLKQRLTNHVHGRSSFVIQALDGDTRRLRRDFRYAYLPIANHRTRVLVEAAAIGHLCPEHVGTHQAKKSLVTT